MVLVTTRQVAKILGFEYESFKKRAYRLKDFPKAVKVIDKSYCYDLDDIVKYAESRKIKKQAETVVESPRQLAMLFLAGKFDAADKRQAHQKRIIRARVDSPVTTTQTLEPDWFYEDRK